MALRRKMVCHPHSFDLRNLWNNKLVSLSVIQIVRIPYLAREKEYIMYIFRSSLRVGSLGGKLHLLPLYVWLVLGQWYHRNACKLKWMASTWVFGIILYLLLKLFPTTDVKCNILTSVLSHIFQQSGKN